jgi:hypothetical protein
MHGGQLYGRTDALMQVCTGTLMYGCMDARWAAARIRGCPDDARMQWCTDNHARLHG